MKNRRRIDSRTVGTARFQQYRSRRYLRLIPVTWNYEVSCHAQTPIAARIERIVFPRHKVFHGRILSEATASKKRHQKQNSGPRGPGSPVMIRPRGPM
jgi:hypothetical protein